MQSIIDQFTILRGESISTIANYTGKTPAQIEIISSIVWGYIVGIILLMYIHGTLLRKQKRIEENLVFLYDALRYQLAKVQYEKNHDQNIKGIKVILETDHKNYTINATAIKEEISNIEQKLGQKCISEEQRKTLTRQTKKKNSIMMYVQGIGRIITVFTAGIYKLFW